MEKKHAHGFFIAHFDREPLNYRFRVHLWSGADRDRRRAVPISADSHAISICISTARVRITRATTRWALTFASHKESPAFALQSGLPMPRWSR